MKSLERLKGEMLSDPDVRAEYGHERAKVGMDVETGQPFPQIRPLINMLHDPMADGTSAEQGEGVMRSEFRLIRALDGGLALKEIEYADDGGVIYVSEDAAYVPYGTSQEDIISAIEDMLDGAHLPVLELKLVEEADGEETDGN